MPKGKKKGKYEHRRTELPCSSDEDAGIDMTNDNYSETSGQSDLKSNHDDAESITSLWTSKTKLKDTSIFVRECLSENRQKVFDAALQHFGIRDVWIEDSTIIIRLPDGRCQDLTSMKELEHLMYWHRKEDLEIAYFNKNVLSENDAQEKQEEKVLEIMEALSARSNAARASAFVALRAALQRRAFDTLLCSHRATLADHIARTLRRGKDGERKAAAAVAPLVALQIGEEGTEEFVAEVRPALTAAAVDKTASLETRTECCSSLAVLCYLMEDDVTEILEVMRVYETIFSGSYLKGDGSVKTSGSAVEEGAWHAAALEAWALLLSLLAPAHARQLLRAARLAQLLEAPALDVRVAAGPALALAHECATADDAPPDADLGALLPRLADLARDSHKYRAKRDRKLQRATFRDVLKYFEEGEVPAASVRVGSETAAWESWCGAAAYGALAAALGGALQPLALRSARLRAALALPDLPPADLQPRPKLNKLQRHLQNTAACKARTLARNKNRDKRSAALAM